MLTLVRSKVVHRCHSARSFMRARMHFVPCSSGPTFRHEHLASSQVRAPAFQLVARKSGRGRQRGRRIAPCDLSRGIKRHPHATAHIVPSAQSRDHFVPARLVGEHHGHLPSKVLTLCVEGNISAGKSTFLADIIEGSETLKEAGTTIAVEPVEKWQNVESCVPQSSVCLYNILDEFYDAPERYAYTFQHYVFMTRYLQEIESRSTCSSVRIMERSVFSDRLIFVESVHDKGWMSDLELSLFNSWYEPFIQISPNLIPDGFVYLRTTAETCMRRLERRARGEEIGIKLEYLQSLHNKHEAWLCSRVTRSAESDYDRVISTEVPDAIRGSVCHVDDERVTALKGVPILILEYDDDINLEADLHVKDNYRTKVEVFVDYLRKKRG